MFSDGMFSDGMFSDGMIIDGMLSDGMFSDGMFSDRMFCMGTLKMVACLPELLVICKHKWSWFFVKAMTTIVKRSGAVILTHLRAEKSPE